MIFKVGIYSKQMGIALMLMMAVACNHKPAVPDTSTIAVKLQVKRFEKDLFTCNTANLSGCLDTLNHQYGEFLRDYIYNIQAFYPHPDTALKYMNLFLNDDFYKKIYDTTTKILGNFSDIQQQLVTAFKLYKYYLPKYNLPTTIITFVGPIEGTANALTSSGLAIGLQGYLGSNFSAYNTDFFSQIYPQYKTRRFEKNYIVTNSINNLIDDNYPKDKNNKTLIQQMIEAGKKYYLLDKILPNEPDTIKLGYTKKQLEFCQKNEQQIWAFFMASNLLFETESNLIAVYLNDGPNTAEISQECPAFVGQFMGWKIVSKWMEKNNKATLEQLMKTPSDKIFQEAKYKP